ncbi:LexA family protein [Streptomyces avermitilis]
MSWGGRVLPPTTWSSGLEPFTILEIGQAVGLGSKGSVAYHLRNLEERGALIRDGRSWRTCRLAR